MEQWLRITFVHETVICCVTLRYVVTLRYYVTLLHYVIALRYYIALLRYVTFYLPIHTFTHPLSIYGHHTARP